MKACGMGSGRAGRWWRLGWVLFVGLAWLAGGCVRGQDLPGVGSDLGLEGMAEVVLPRPDYVAQPFDERAELGVRIGGVEPAGEGRWKYRIYYMGMEGGNYVLADWLTLPGGGRDAGLEEIFLRVDAHLPADHDGRLEAQVAGRFPFLGGYRALLWVAGGVWVGGLAGYAWVFRRRPVEVAVDGAGEEAGYAERLRPLVMAAAAGELGLAERTLLERLVMGYWREELQLGGCRVPEALARVKAHPQAGGLLRALEDWLHRPGVRSADEVDAMLDLYRRLPSASGGGSTS